MSICHSDRHSFTTNTHSIQFSPTSAEWWCSGPVIGRVQVLLSYFSPQQLWSSHSHNYLSWTREAVTPLLCWSDNLELTLQWSTRSWRQHQYIPVHTEFRDIQCSEHIRYTVQLRTTQTNIDTDTELCLPTQMTGKKGTGLTEWCWMNKLHAVLP